jgi:hemerythrin-like domain-containing protein
MTVGNGGLVAKRAKKTKRTKATKGTKGIRKRTKATKRARATRRARARTGTRKAARRGAKKPKKPAAAASAKATVKGALAGAVQAVAKRLPGTSADLDALTLLERDHRRLEDLLKRGEETTEAAVTRRRELLETVTKMLTIHETIEEQVLYPALKQHPETRAIVLEGFQEHHVADLIVKELHQVAEDNEAWGAKFKVLKENIEHHIEEEEGSMFRSARGVMTREQLLGLGTKMARMKAELEATGRSS